MKFITRSRSDFGNVRTTALRPTGIIIAAATPCGTRAATSRLALGARPHSTDDTVNRPSANRKMRRLPKRSASQPLTGIETASDRM